MTIDPLVRQLCLSHRDAIPAPLAAQIRAMARKKAVTKLRTMADLRRPQPGARLGLRPCDLHIAILPAPKPEVIDALIADIARRHMVSVRTLFSRSRAKPLPQIRHEVMYRMRDDFKMSRSQIGRYLGGYDNGTILHGIRAHARRNGLPDITGYVIKQ